MTDSGHNRSKAKTRANVRIAILKRTSPPRRQHISGSASSTWTWWRIWNGLLKPVDDRLFYLDANQQRDLAFDQNQWMIRRRKASRPGPLPEKPMRSPTC